MKNEELNDIAGRWEGVTKGYTKLTFEEAHADMRALLAAVRESEKLKSRIAELEMHVKKRNSDMQAFASEVSRLAMEKYGDWMQK